MTDFADQRRKMSLWLAAFSVLLSVLAFATDPVINRDGMHYISMARLAADGMAAEVMARESWPFLSLFLGWSASWTTIDPLYLGIGFSAVCGLLMQLFTFRLALRYDSRYLWLAFLLAACFPVLAHYRSYIIRDAGAWVGMLGAMLAMAAWWAQPRWRHVFVCLAWTALAFLCRTEMILILVAAGLVWMRGLHRQGRFGSVPFSAVMLLTALAGMLVVAVLVYLLGYERMQFYWQQTGGSLFHNFDRAVERIARKVVDYLDDDLPLVLGSGLLVMLLAKLVSLNGIFALPLVAGARRPLLARVVNADGGMALLLAVLLLAVLLLFLFVNLFLVTRYVVPLSLALLPVVYLGLIALAERIRAPGWRRAFVAIAVLAMVDQAVATGASKRYIIEAGDWVKAHQQDLGSLFIADQRVAFYAGAGYDANSKGLGLQAMPEDAATLVVTFRSSPEEQEQEILRLQEETGFSQILFQADNGDGDGVLVLQR